MQTTPDHIVERNRLNARHSTGPKTEYGKSISRRNAMRHGLTANPAASTVEDEGAFERLLEVLNYRFCPSDPLEEGLVQRIALALWRLQRAAKIDGAITGLQTEAVAPAREQIHRWVTEITQAFAAVQWVEVTDNELLRQRHAKKPATKGRRWFRAERQFLEKADRYRDDVLLSDGMAIQAMIHLIRELTDQLEKVGSIEPVQAQLLAWLLGESAERLVEPDDADDRSANYFPDERDYASSIDDLLGQARKRPAEDPLPSALITTIQARLMDLEVRSRSAVVPYTDEHESRLKIQAMLPSDKDLDRLMRYEVHSERSIIRSIETLSKLRGVKVESIRATMTRPEQGGGSVEIRGERTTWSGS
jgi:hypothetical protein